MDAPAVAGGVAIDAANGLGFRDAIVNDRDLADGLRAAQEIQQP